MSLSRSYQHDAQASALANKYPSNGLSGATGWEDRRGEVQGQDKETTVNKPAVILDFGNVIGFFDHGLAYARFGSRLGVQEAELKRMLHERGFAGLLAEFETGHVSAAEFARRATGSIGLEIPFEAFERDWADIFWPNLSIVSVVTGLKAQGHPLALGSNTNITHADWFRRQFASTLKHFDALVLSYEIGVMKPELGFYQACARAVARAPGECVFIDDVPENVAGAKAAGLQALLYTTTPALVGELHSLGIRTGAGHA